MPPAVLNKKLPLFLGSVLLVLALGQIFTGKWILPQSFGIGPLKVHYYGIIMAAAVLAGAWLAEKRAERYGMDSMHLDSVFVWLAVGGFAGARLYHVLSSLPHYSHHLFDIVKVWEGGLSIFGALMGGFISLLLCKRFLNLQNSIYQLLDWLAPSFVLGQFIGRLGNLFNYEAYGYPTSLPWKMFVPEQFRDAVFAGEAYFHPLFLYEMAASGIILAVLLKISKKETVPGRLFFYYLLLYNFVRFFLELLRVDSAFVGTFRLNSLASLALIIVAGIGWGFLGNRYEKST